MIHMLYTFETNVLWKKRTILKVNESSSNHQFSGGYVRWFISFNFNVHLLSTTWPFSVALSRCQEEMEGRAPKRHLSARHRPVRWQNAFQYNFETEALRVWPGWFAWKKCWKMKKISGFFSCLICWRMFIRKSTHYILMDSVCVFCFNKQKKIGPTCLLKTQVETYSAELALRILYMCLGMPPFWNFPRWETRYNHPLRWMVEIGDWTNFQPFSTSLI